MKHNKEFVNVGMKAIDERMWTIQQTKIYWNNIFVKIIEKYWFHIQILISIRFFKFEIRKKIIN